MRDRVKSRALIPADLEGQGIPGVSIPDRRRIDSDVRAFLREPSTPWIVFDREGRPPSQLAVGEVLPVALSSVIPDHGFFTATAVIDAPRPSATPPEPSSLAVASDLQEEVVETDLGASAIPIPIPMRRLTRRVLGAAGVGAAMFAMLVYGAFALTTGVTVPDTHAARSAAHGSPVPADLSPPDLDVKAPAEPVVAPAAPSVTATVPPPAPEEKAAAKRFGKLSITGEARSRDVFFDGKRLLGHGTRTFSVICGAHSIAVGTKADARDVDVPCNAELVVSK